MQEVLLSLCKTYPDLSESVRDVILRLDKWSDFLTQRVPGDIWLKIFVDCVDSCPSSISILSRVCKAWNHFVRKHARRLIHAYLSKYHLINPQCVWLQKSLTILISVQSVESLKQYNTYPGGHNLWGFEIDISREILRSGKPEKTTMAVEHTEISVEQGWRTGFAFGDPTKKKPYHFLVKSVKHAPLFNNDVYSGKVSTILVPKPYAVETRDGDIVIKRQKI